MSNNKAGRQQLVSKTEQNLYLFTIQVELFKHRIAEEMKLNNTDLSCACLLAMHGPHTASQLAKATGLTTGAITTVIDRLERAGYASRESDSADRRRTVVALTSTGVEKLQEMFAPIDLSDFWKQYTDKEIATIANFFSKLTKIKG